MIRSAKLLQISHDSSRYRRKNLRHYGWLPQPAAARAIGKVVRSVSSSQILAPVAGHVHGQLETAPDTQFIESAPQVVLDDLLGRANEPANFTIGKALPDQGGYLDFFGG
jgi:hypothetical protein